MRGMKLFFLILSFLSLQFSLQAQERFKYDPKNKRDPFSPLIGPNGEYLTPFSGLKSIGDMRLEGIIWDPKGDSYAIINGEVVKEGDYLAGALVSKIHSKEVVILLEEEEFTLVLIEEEGNVGEKNEDENQ